MRKLNNFEAVKINNAEEAMEFLQYLEENTDLKWSTGVKPTGIRQNDLNWRELPIFFEVCGTKLWPVKLEDNLEDETKIIPLSEFLKPKVI